MPRDESISSLNLLYQVSRELATALDLRSVLERILFLSLKHVGGERASIVVLDEAGKPVDAAIVIGQKIHDHTTQQLRDTIERGLAGWVVRNRQPAWVPDTSKDERWLLRPDDAWDRSGPKAALCVPLMARQELAGVLTLVHPTPGSYLQEHYDLMQAIADLSGVAVLNARLYSESQRQARVMSALVVLASAINASLQVDEVLQRILDETIRALQVETAALALLEENNDLVFHAAAGENSQEIVGRRIPAGQGIAGWVQEHGEGIIIPDIRQDTRFIPEDQFSGMHVRAISLAPIFAQEKVIGILEAINPRSAVFDPDALHVLSGIGSLAGSTIRHAQLFGSLQAATNRYRELFDDSLDPILVTGWDGIVHESNRQAEVLSGYPSVQLQNKSMPDLLASSEHGPLMDLEALRDGKRLDFEAHLKARGTEPIPVQVKVKRVHFEGTESLQWQLHDISERRSLDLLREDLAAMVYHDLRSPLANIVSSLDILGTLSDREENKTKESIISIARRSTERIQRLVSSLLDINRLESGQAVVSQEAVDPLILAGEAAETVRFVTSSRRQELITQLPQEMPQVWVDADMIRRVLINLIENASKFSPSGGRIELGASHEGQWLQFWVADNGPGIPETDREHIFDKFTRLKGEHAPKGLGIGLAFCRLAVQGHGGRIWVESNPDHGSIFYFTLPLIP